MALYQHLRMPSGRLKSTTRKCLTSALHAACVLTSSRLRLATHLYAEHLLDREHYMEWLVSGLETCSQAKLPMWLLVTQIYWKDLLRLRKYGRRLVAALLNQNTTVRLHPTYPRDLEDVTDHQNRFKLILIMTSWLHCRQE